MSGPDLPEIPASMKSVQVYLKIASQHDQRDPVVSYWARFYVAQTGLKLTKRNSEETNFLVKLMTWLETTKKELHDNEAITNDVAAQAHLENWALKLFLYADKNDRASNFSKNVIQSFYTAGFLYDVLTVFGDLTDEAAQNRKYAKWKAAYIHNCLKNGETPVPGPIDQEGDDITAIPRSAEDIDDAEIDFEADNEAGDKEERPTSDDQPEPEPEPHDDAAGSENTDPSNQPDSDPEPPAEADAPANNETPSEPENEIEPNDEGEEADPTPPPRTDAYGFPSVPNISSSSDVNPANSGSPTIPAYPNLPPSNPHPYNPAPTPTTPPVSSNFSLTPQPGNVNLSADQMIKAQKYIKWAGSAINYDDIPTSVENLQKALRLLTTGQDS